MTASVPHDPASRKTGVGHPGRADRFRCRCDAIGKPPRNPGEIEARIIAAVRVGHLPVQDTALAATALLGALHDLLSARLRPTISMIPRSFGMWCRPQLCWRCARSS